VTEGNDQDSRLTGSSYVHFTEDLAPKFVTPRLADNRASFPLLERNAAADWPRGSRVKLCIGFNRFERMS
jgi:hypothetical protein